MRYVFLLMCAVFFTMCKSSKKLPEVEAQSYIILLVEGYHPKSLSKQISCDVLEYKPASKSQNLWSVSFSCDADSKLKAQLLNHEKVINVLTEEDAERMNTKNKNRGKSSPFGNKSEKQ